MVFCGNTAKINWQKRQKPSLCTSVPIPSFTVVAMTTGTGELQQYFNRNGRWWHRVRLAKQSNEISVAKAILSTKNTRVTGLVNDWLWPGCLFNRDQQVTGWGHSSYQLNRHQKHRLQGFWTQAQNSSLPPVAKHSERKQLSNIDHFILNRPATLHSIQPKFFTSDFKGRQASLNEGRDGAASFPEGHF